MKRFILLLLIMPTYLLSNETSLLYLPREDNPFVLFSPTGTISIETGEDMWNQSMLIQADGKGGNVQVTAATVPVYSLEQKNLIVWVKPENTKALKDFWIFTANDADFSDRIVFLVSSDKTQLREGEWNRLSFTLSSGSAWGQPDPAHLRAFQFWLNDDGTEPVSIKIGPVLLEETLQDSAVAITFDDGWKSQYETAAPIMADFNLKGTAYIIPERIGTDNYMSLEELRSLTDSFHWSLGGHYMERLDNKTESELTAIFQAQQAWFDDNSFSAYDFAFPNGASGGEVMGIVPTYFRSARSIIEFRETLPPGNRYNLRVLNIVPPVNPAVLEERLRTMDSKGEVLILVLHKIGSESNAETEVSASEFQSLCEVVARSGIPVKTMEELSANFSVRGVDLILDWSAATLFQPEKTVVTETVSPLEDDPLSTTGPGTPLTVLNKTQFDFSLDWRMAWGLNGDGDPRFYSQLDDLHLYIQNQLSEGTRLYASAGIEEVNFDDLNKGAINGSDVYLKALYMEQDLNDEVTFEAGYFSPDPLHKWLQVTRSAGIEPALGQDMTPTSLWINGKWQHNGPFGAQFALVPDVIGTDQAGSDINTLTYQENLGVPNLFSSMWYDTDSLDGEIAFALNGDTLKLAAEGGYYRNINSLRLSASAGLKYTRGEEFSTYPEWDHLNNTLRLSTGWSFLYPYSAVYLNPGIAYQAVFGESSFRQMSGLDFGILYKSFEFYTVLTLYDLADMLWGETSGIESGIILHYKDVDYMTGFTMAGFNTLSGLYNNKTWNEGGVDGIFFRIKATYW